ncbi:MAG TPA: hypothetical protein VFX38_05250 [Gammaproteobacteria bacterium]|nr:hypothetical protein [Gammaproteobacteria bacterium]
MNRTVRQALASLSIPLAFAAGPTFAATSVSPAGPALDAAHVRSLPPALRPVLYAALSGDAQAAYRFDADGCASLPGRGLGACFDRGGAHFSGGDSSLALRLIAYGRGGADPSPAKLIHVTPVSPTFHRNRVNYRHAALTEWWRVLPVGFEQGFTLSRRPSGNGHLQLILATNDRAERRDGILSWGRLNYGGLVVVDAAGHTVPATLRSGGNRILIAVNDAHAAYPLTIDPLLWIEQKALASDGAAFNAFGNAVAVAGSNALVGAPDVNGWEGAVYAFAYENGIWTQTQKFFADDGVSGDGANFGATIAMDGSTALIGAVGATVNGNSAQGAAYVFTESNGAWSQEAKLVSSDGTANNYFGQGVSIDGDTALVGAYGASVHGNSLQGEAYVFTNSGGTWTQAQILTAADGAASAFFGHSVGLSGTTAVVGAPYAAVGGNTVGAAYLFTDSGGSWSQTQKLIANDGTGGAGFGYSVALSGTTALIGANGQNVGSNSFQGAAYIFSDSGGTWTQAAELTSNDGVGGDDFGYAVALANSGVTALIGADRRTVNGNLNQGAAYRFTDAGGSWTQTAEYVAGDGATGDFYGAAVAVSDDTSLVAAPIKTVKGNAVQGEAYFYDGGDLGLAVSAPQTVGQGQQYVSQTIATNNASAASPAVSATIAVPADASFVAATATQGSCSETSGLVTCDFGAIGGNAGTATANVTLKATGNVGDTIENVSGIAKATPPLTASAATTITEGGACPGGYSEYDGDLAAEERAHSPIYRAPAGVENAILDGPSGFQLYGVFQNARGRKTYRIPGNEVHRSAPAGTFTWVVKAGDAGGAYTLCVLHP